MKYLCTFEILTVDPSGSRESKNRRCKPTMRLSLSVSQLFAKGTHEISRCTSVLVHADVHPKLEKDLMHAHRMKINATAIHEKLESCLQYISLSIQGFTCTVRVGDT